MDMSVRPLRPVPGSENGIVRVRELFILFLLPGVGRARSADVAGGDRDHLGANLAGPLLGSGREVVVDVHLYHPTEPALHEQA